MLEFLVKFNCSERGGLEVSEDPKCLCRARKIPDYAAMDVFGKEHTYMRGDSILGGMRRFTCGFFNDPGKRRKGDKQAGCLSIGCDETGMVEGEIFSGSIDSSYGGGFLRLLYRLMRFVLLRAYANHEFSYRYKTQPHFGGLSLKTAAR